MNSSLYRNTVGRVQIPIVLCPDPQKAQITHIDGPLTFEVKWGDRQCLVRGKDNIFDVHIATQGESPKNFRQSVYATLSTEEIPKDLHPIAEFEFESLDPDDKPVVILANLDLRC